MNNRKSYFKGLISGAALCIALIAVLTVTGCFGGSGIIPIPSIKPSSSAETEADSESGGNSSQSEEEPETGLNWKGEVADISGDYKEIEKRLSTLQEIVDKYYIGPKDVSAQDLKDGIYNGFMNALGDPYTVYYNEKEYADLQESMSGTYSGIGVMIQQDVQTMSLTIVRVFAGSPAEEAGMLKDDIITRVNGEDIAGQDIYEVVAKIKGKEGTTVDITVYRPSIEDYVDLTVERRVINTPMLEYEMLENDIGYILIYEFEDSTDEQFSAAVDDLTAKGMKGLVIDLRDNPGGLVDACANVLDRILPSRQLLVYTIDKNEKKDEVYSKNNDTIDIPIVTLVNGNSASASEIMAGALQDYGKTELVGTTTFGKGIVQYILSLEGGAGMKVTSAAYYTPSGRCIHGKGLKPDITVEMNEELEGDEQLTKALEVLQEKIGN